MRTLLKSTGLPLRGARLSLMIVQRGVKGTRKLIELADRLASEVDETLERISAQASEPATAPASAGGAALAPRPTPAMPAAETTPTVPEPVAKPTAPEPKPTAPVPARPEEIAAVEGLPAETPPRPSEDVGGPPRDEPVDEEIVLAAEFADAGAAEGAGAEVHVDEPWHGYRDMRAREILDRIVAESEEALTLVLLYERGHRRRSTVMSAAERELSNRQRAAAAGHQRGTPAERRQA